MLARILGFMGLMGVLLTTPLAASDLGDLTEAERQAFRDEVRNYLLDNPEVLLEALDVLEERQQLAQAEAERSFLDANAAEIFEDGYSFVGGNPDGDITLVEFMDYRCSFCRRAKPEVDALLTSDGNIRWIVKEFPILGAESVRASQFAIATKMIEGDAAYAEVHDALMAHRGNYSDQGLETIASLVGFDAGPVMAQMEAPEVADIIARNQALAQALQITGTPTFVLQTEIVRGYVPLDTMRTMVRQLRAGN